MCLFVLQQCGLSTEAIPVDYSGVTLPATPIHLLYTTPAHQFPLGMIMTIKRRVALLQWANSNKGLIIEDDYDSEFRYKGLPIPSLAKMDQLQRVIYFGTFSKTLLPSLRISYMILPKSLVTIKNAPIRLDKIPTKKNEKIINERTVDVHIKNLREKIAGFSDYPFIVSVRGLGYKFNIDF